MKQPSARERLYLHWNPLAANHDEMYSLLLEVERAAAYKAMMRCARMVESQKRLKATPFHMGPSTALGLAAISIRSEARKLKVKGKR